MKRPEDMSNGSIARRRSWILDWPYCNSAETWGHNAGCRQEQQVAIPHGQRAHGAEHPQHDEYRGYCEDGSVPPSSRASRATALFLRSAESSAICRSLGRSGRGVRRSSAAMSSRTLAMRASCRFKTAIGLPLSALHTWHHYSDSRGAEAVLFSTAPTRAVTCPRPATRCHRGVS